MKLMCRLILESFLMLAIIAFPALAIYGIIKMVVHICHS